jgi:hypothetical protein
MIALAEGRKHPAGSGRGAFVGTRTVAAGGGVRHAGDVRRCDSRGVREGNRPLAAWKGEAPTPGRGRGRAYQCLLVAALRLDLDVVGWVLADHELLDF